MRLPLQSGKLTSLRGPRAWAGVFFGPSGLELATARSETGTPSPMQHASVNLPSAEETSDPSARWTKAAEALRVRIDPREYRIVTALSCENALCETVKLPTTEPGELKQMLDLQIDRLTPLPLEEVVYSFQPLEVAEGQTRMLVAIARKDVVNERVGALETAGLPPEIVTLDVLAVFRDLLARGTLRGDERLNAFVLVGDAAMNVIVYSGGRPVAVRSIPYASGGIRSDEGRMAAREELRRTLLSMETEQSREPGVLAFLPWGAELRRECEHLARLWGANGSVLPDGAVAGPSLSLCAVSAAEADSARLNLLPDEWRQRRRTARLRRQLMRAALMVGAAYVVGLIVFLSLLLVRQSHMGRLRAETNALRPKYMEARRTHSELVAMQKQLDTTYSSLEVLREVTALMPENLKLNAFVFKKDQNVTLRGLAQAASDAIDFQSRLEKCHLFSSVTAGRMATEGGGLTRFDIVCNLKSSAEVPVAYGAK